VIQHEREGNPPATFIPLTEVRGPHELRKESWRRGAHDLVAGDALVARLDYEQWSGKTRAQAADGEWEFGRTKGFTQRTTKVVDPVMALTSSSESAAAGSTAAVSAGAVGS